MDSDLKKQWGCPRQPQQQQEYESEEQHQQDPAKLLELNALTTTTNNKEEEDHPLPSSSSAGSTLPLFVPDHPTQPQPLPHQHPPTKPHPPPRIWSYFSTAQWQELELQALIYRYMLSGATVPPELLHPIKTSLPHQPTSFFHDDHHQPHLQCYLHYPQPQPFRFQAGYWGSASMDPEPGRCRRTDGKKWRCSRDVVPGQKYCERHVHRGRNRSRKPVEIPPTSRPTAPAAKGNVGWGHLKTNPNSVTVAALGNVTTASPFVSSGPSDHSSIDLFQMNNRSHSGPPPEVMAQSNSSGFQVLRHFFDDWPRPLHDPSVASSTGLSMSTAGNSSSDVSLKLSTGDSERGGAADGTPERDRAQGSNWLAGWLPNRVASMGGPLAEALRPSVTTNHSLPTSILHQLTCGLAAETSLITQV